jgi:hypothetical protein
LLSISSFGQAQVPHFKTPDLTPRQQLNEIGNNRDNTSMITTPFSFKYTFLRQLIVTFVNLHVLSDYKVNWFQTEKGTQKLKPSQNNYQLGSMKQ